MSDIPEDIQKAARLALSSAHPQENLTAVLARALMAERERCATIADNYDPPLPDDVYVGEVMRGQTEIAHSISTAIRKGAL